ncbi:hypothetical protein [Ferrimicrobium acidiphilum]|uniref:Uncharacterized protein n=1 Tax=Ferrimicrobium acidiphilum DSM 19497 TaxID=1121877 RepID=A0A0D8FSS8_9ACTN|nr:hypothetical protein [Ferrimicrobium acidiphilum]KJE76325.1 hypothetical protein FEAC_19350 [Ferrimicrobium acidiphilum DSM 19497]MCL5053721.1 hypothetical protein [Gammaproteobacteria bacterium]
MTWLERMRGRGASQTVVSGADGRPRESLSTALFDQNQVFEGEVTSFDPHVGLGLVRLDCKPVCELRFHCITIDDGSRSIGVGRRVTVRLKPSFGGELEVAALHKLG